MDLSENALGSIDILDLISVRMPALSPVEGEVGRAILANPGEVAESTIAKLAQSANSSEASVTRFCRSIGLSGYPQLRMKLAVAIERRASGVGGSGFAMLEDFEPGEPMESIVHKVAAVNAEAVSLTARHLNLGTLAEVVDSLLSAQRILCFGVGSSAIAAEDAATKFRLVGRSATASADVHSALMLTALFTPADLVIGFSHAGHSREVVDVLANASGSGSTTVVVTSDPASPAARASTHCLQTAAREMSFRSGGVASRIAQMTVIDSLFVVMSHRSFRVSTEAAQNMHDAVKGHRTDG